MLVKNDLERSTERHWDMAAFLDVDYRRTLAVTVKIPSKQKEYVCQEIDSFARVLKLKNVFQK